MSTKVQQSTTINQPIEKVFAYLTDSRNVTKWQTAIIETRATVEGPAQVGSKVTDVRTFIGQKMESTYEITEVEPNARMAFKSISGPFPYQGAITFQSLGNATEVTFAIEMEPKGFFKLAEGMLAGNINKELEGDLGRAKQLLEAGG